MLQIENHDILKQIITEAPNYIFWKDSSFLYRGCNRNFALVAGLLSPDEIVGKSDYELPWGKFNAEMYREEDKLVFTTGQSILKRETILIGYDKLEYKIVVSKVPLFDKELKKVIGVAGIYIDVTKEREAEAALKQAKILEEKAQAMKTLAATIAHELRTPLRSAIMATTGIGKYFPMLLEAYQLAKAEKLPVPKIESYYFDSLLPALQSIRSENEEAMNIIDLLLMNLNWTSNSLMQIEREQCSINASVERALQRYFYDSREEGLVHWKSEHNFIYSGDELLIVHILFNLLKNAFYQIKATKKGEIYIWTEKGAEYNQLHFKDTAKGISPDVLPRIFDQFFTDTRHGTGIGLAFCKMAMEAIDGRITCTSVLGEYAEFVLYFPCK